MKLSFLSLKMMVKSGLELILKLTEPLQRYLLSCQANSANLGRYFCTGQQQLWRGSVNFKINSRPLFTIIFKLKNGNFMTRDFSPLIKRVLAGVTYHLIMLIIKNTRWSDHIFISNVDLNMKINTIYIMDKIIPIKKSPGELFMAFIKAFSSLPI